MKIILRLIRESILFAWQFLRSNVLRTALSLLGVTVGIFCIILPLALVDSLEKEMSESFDMIGSDLIFIQKWPMGPEEGDEGFAWWKYINRRQPSLRDTQYLKKRMSTAKAVAFQGATSKTLEYKNNHVDNAGVVGVSCGYNEAINVDIGEGRYFSQMECEGASNACIIGYEIKSALFGDTDPIGKSIKAGGLKLTVIGVFKKEGASLLGSGFDRLTLVSAQFGSRLIDYDRVDCNIYVKAKEGYDLNEVKDEIIAEYRTIRKLKPEQGNDFSINETSMITGIIDSIFGVITSVGLMIGAFAIFVGGFSIMNIMFVSVKERTSIIGIQKALGAKNYFILVQFLFESIALCVIGGLFGLAFIFIITIILNAFMDSFTVVLSFTNFAIGIGVSMAIGIVAGIVPAWRAGKLNPVEAIRSK